MLEVAMARGLSFLIDFLTCKCGCPYLGVSAAQRLDTSTMSVLEMRAQSKTNKNKKIWFLAFNAEGPFKES